MSNSKLCFECGEPGTETYGYIICDSCKSNLRLFSDKTIKKYIDEYAADGSKGTFEEEMDRRLEFLENDYKKKRIKLLYIKERIETL